MRDHEPAVASTSRSFPSGSRTSATRPSSGGAGRMATIAAVACLALLPAAGCGKLGGGGGDVSVTISPRPTSLAAGSGTPFMATVPNGQKKGVNWTLTPADGSGGTLSNQSLYGVFYNAPATPPNPNSVTLTATSVADNSKSDSVTFTITGGQVSVMITTRPTSVGAGSAAAFSVTVNNDVGGAGVTWSLTPTSGGGTFTNQAPLSVTYTAPATAPNPNSVTITATSKADTTKSDSVTFTIGPASTTTAAVVGSSVPFPIFAGDPVQSIAITVTNDASGDVLTATLTVDANTGLACTVATCGTLVGPVTAAGTPGNYTVSYMPPAAPGFTTQTAPTIVVHSSISGSFDDTDYIEVDPAGQPLVTIGGLGGLVVAGSAQRTVTAVVYNDPTHAGVTFMPLTASGYTCTSLTSNSCGAQGTPGAPTFSGNTTTVTIPYTPPASVPASPYDRPRVLAVSAANNTQAAVQAALLSATPRPASTGLQIPLGEKLLTAPTTGAAITLDANIGNDTGSSRTVNWTLTAGAPPVSCAPTCGTLGTPVPTGNGSFVSSTVTYTPPATLPGAPAVTPRITATSVDNRAATDSFTFTLIDGSCGSGNEAVLKGQYAFLLRGGGANAGYGAVIGSFTADGAGHITAGLADFNQSNGGVFTGPTIVPASSSYSVGSDNRVCLTLVDSGGDLLNLRAGVGGLVSGVATQGRVILFNDINGRRQRLSGVLLQQDPTAFSASQIKGTYALGLVGVDGSGGRLAGAGVITADGLGTLSNFSADFDDAGTASGNLTGGTGSYTIAANGRGTATTTITAPGGAATTKSLLYVVSASQILALSSDSALAGKSITSGELRKQSGPFASTALDNGGYVFYTTGVDGSNGGNDVVLGQATVGASGNATVWIDENDNGMQPAEVTGSIQFVIASSGRTTISGAAVGPKPDILYLIDSSSGFLVGTGPQVRFGYLEKQTGGPFTNASLSGGFFFGADAPTTGTRYQSGRVSLDGMGGVTGNGSHCGPNGLGADVISPSNGGTYSFSNTSMPVGKGTVGGSNQVAYVISPSKLAFLGAGAQPQLFVVQK